MRRIMVGVAALLLVAACTSGSDRSDGTDRTSGPTPAAARPDGPATAPAVGQCVAHERADLDDLAPDFRTVVSCTEPHVYEVTDVFDVPTQFLEGATKKERLANRDDLARVGNEDPEREEFVTQAFARCNPGASARAGVTSLFEDGDDAGAELLMGSASVWLTLADEETWADGSRVFVCSIRYTAPIDTAKGDENLAPEPITSPDEAPVYERFTTSTFPSDRRLCVVVSEASDETVDSCDSSHYAEYLFAYDALAVFGRTAVEKVDGDEPLPVQQDALDGPCQEALETLRPTVGDDVVARGELVGEAWFDDETDEGYFVQCIVVAADDGFDLPAGSVFDGEEIIAVPYAPRTEV